MRIAAQKLYRSAWIRWELRSYWPRKSSLSVSRRCFALYTRRQGHPGRQGCHLVVATPWHTPRTTKLRDGTLQLVFRSPQYCRRLRVQVPLNEHRAGQPARPQRILNDGSEEPSLQRVCAYVWVLDRGWIDFTTHHQSCATWLPSGIAMVLEVFGDRPVSDALHDRQPSRDLRRVFFQHSHCSVIRLPGLWNGWIGQADDAPVEKLWRMHRASQQDRSGPSRLDAESNRCSNRVMRHASTPPHCNVALHCTAATQGTDPDQRDRG